MKNSLLFLVLASLTLSSINLGCKSEAKIDEDGAAAEIKGK